jgi:TetR/AcrR family transcriptional repressor of nem operon
MSKNNVSDLITDQEMAFGRLVLAGTMTTGVPPKDSSCSAYQQVGIVHAYPLVGTKMPIPEARHESKTKLLQAAIRVIRVKGYTATRVEDVCEAAGLTKGSFFHHFDSKDELALAAADYWMESTEAHFGSASYHELADPLERLLAYVDFRKALLTGELPDFTCLAGTMVQEVYETHPAIREACNRSISGHAATLLVDIEEAMRERGMRPEWTAESLALYTQATLQGAFILAKARGGAAIAAQCIDHLRRYIELLFQPSNSEMTRLPI